MGKARQMSVDVPPVTAQEALQMMCHHLQLAAAYYEATSSDTARNRNTAEGLLRASVGSQEDNPTLFAGRAFIKTLDAYYAKLPKY